MIDLSAKADFKVLGPRYGKDTKAVASAIASLDHATIASVMDGKAVTVGEFTITDADIVVERTPRAGTVVASEGSLSVALDCAVDRTLHIEGLARELVNRLQGMRRDLDLDVTDHIVVSYTTDNDDVVDAFMNHAALIGGEVLAEAIDRSDQIDSSVDVDLGMRP